jgi:molecular chaperone GrpE (heat shock protein)
LKDEARAAMLKKDKKTALQIMRKVALIRKSLADKDVQYQKLLGILEQLAQTKQTKEIIEGYKACSKAFKETLARQGLTSENVIFKYYRSKKENKLKQFPG